MYERIRDTKKRGAKKKRNEEMISKEKDIIKLKEKPGVRVVGDNSAEWNLPASRTQHDDNIGRPMYRKHCIKSSSIICVCCTYLREIVCTLVFIYYNV